MNIFSKLFQFFSKKNQTTDSFTSSKTEESNDYKNSLKFNPNNLLDPRVCRGDKFIPNMLISLGANPKLANNQIVIAHIKPMFFQMLPLNYITMLEQGKRFSKKDIQECFTNLKIKSEIYSQHINQSILPAVTITSNGNIKIRGKFRNSSESYDIGDREISMDQDKNITIKENYKSYCSGNWTAYHSTEYVYNKFNVLMKETDTKFSMENGDVLTDSYISIRKSRDNNYPFIINYDEIDCIKRDKTVTKSCCYAFSNPENPELMASSLLSLDFVGGEPIQETESSLDKYYQEHKDKIIKLFSIFKQKQSETDERGRSLKGLCDFALTSRLMGQACQKAYKKMQGQVM